MYFRERVEFVSRSWRRRETALKKDSWIVGRAEVEEEEEVLVVLFLTELVMLCDLLVVVVVVEIEGVGVSETGLVVLDALPTVGEDSFVDGDSVGNTFSGCEAWGLVVGAVKFAYKFTGATDGLDTGADSAVDLTVSEGLGCESGGVWVGASDGRQMSSAGPDSGRSKI
jgi:hypothetical protein